MSRTHAVGLTLLLLVTGKSLAQTTADLRREAEGLARAGGNLPWDSTAPLVWTQFRGPPRPVYSTAAETSSSVTYEIGCLGQETRFAVLATFSTTESWVRPDIPKDSIASRQILGHEQTHFDITEVFAREFRRALASTTGLCPGNLNGARQLFDSLNAASRILHTRYDDETGHGTRADSQAAWTARVRARLDSLAPYSGRE